jgi:DNA-binding NtrC family response regulator
VPPLRERKEDLLRLAAEFAEREQAGTRFSASAAEALLLWSWPLKVRELLNVTRAAAIRAVSDEKLIRPAHLPGPIAAPVLGREPAGKAAPANAAAAPATDALAPAPASASASDGPTEAELRRVIERCAGNMARVAEFFEKDRQQIYRWVKKYGIDVTAYRKV